MRKFHYCQEVSERLTHYLFRYPAKFHPPVARKLIQEFSKPEDVVLDPFCGSGTLLVESVLLGRQIIGVDVDPVATFVSRTKTLPISTCGLRTSADKLLHVLPNFERPRDDYERMQFEDLTDTQFNAEVCLENLSLPQIPNLFHWFRRYVAIDLALIKREIDRLQVPPFHREFLKLCFAAIIRNSSNADPVPVSGLEVTSHMRRREELGRQVNPYALLRRTLKRSLDDWEKFDHQALANRSLASVIRGDATQIQEYVHNFVDVVITSPPYHNAVDYYRRHTLETYWLGFVQTPEERLALRPQYVGRDRIAKSDPVILKSRLTSSLASNWESKIAAIDQHRARAFRHYVLSMTKCLRGISGLLTPGGRAVFVVGKNSWNGYEIPTVELFNEMAAPQFRHVDQYWYGIKNRYMTYSRHNNANIDKEYVLIYEKL